MKTTVWLFHFRDFFALVIVIEQRNLFQQNLCRQATCNVEIQKTNELGKVLGSNSNRTRANVAARGILSVMLLLVLCFWLAFRTLQMHNEQGSGSRERSVDEDTYLTSLRAKITIELRRCRKAHSWLQKNPIHWPDTSAFNAGDSRVPGPHAASLKLGSLMSRGRIRHRCALSTWLCGSPLQQKRWVST